MASNDMTSGEVAALMGVSRQTVHMWRRFGLIPFRKEMLPGQERGRFFYPRTDIERLAKVRRSNVVQQAG